MKRTYITYLVLTMLSLLFSNLGFHNIISFQILGVDANGFIWVFYMATFILLTFMSVLIVYEERGVIKEYFLRLKHSKYFYLIAVFALFGVVSTILAFFFNLTIAGFLTRLFLGGDIEVTRVFDPGGLLLSMFLSIPSVLATACFFKWMYDLLEEYQKGMEFLTIPFFIIFKTALISRFALAELVISTVVVIVMFIVYRVKRNHIAFPVLKLSYSLTAGLLGLVFGLIGL